MLEKLKKLQKEFKEAEQDNDKLLIGFAIHKLDTFIYQQENRSNIKNPLTFVDVVSSSDELCKFLKKINPYPKDIFTEPTKKDYKTMNKALKKHGLTSDKFFGSWGRTVWNNCAKEIKEIIDYES